MPQQPNEVDDNQTLEVSAPPFIMEIPPSKYLARERFAADDALKGRGGVGVRAALRDVLSAANGKTVVLTIEAK